MEAMPLENRASKHAHGRVVFDEQDGLGRSTAGSVEAGCVSRVTRGIHLR
jgi:hypothetical protein